MIEHHFPIDITDKGLVALIKKEANEVISKIDKNDPKYHGMFVAYRGVISVAKAIDDTEPQSTEDIDFILNTILNIWNKEF